MYLSKTSLLLALLPLTQAYECTASIALDWPANNDFTGGSGGSSDGSSVDDCSKKYGSQSSAPDADQLAACLALVDQSQCNSVGGSACGESSSDGSSDDGLIKKRNLSARADMECTTSETCYQYTDMSLLCLDVNGGLYHDDVGGNGDIKDGTYTDPAGNVQTGTGTATATRTATSSAETTDVSSTETSASEASETGSSATGAAASGTFATPTATSASATLTSGGERLQAAGAVVGGLGLVVGMVL